PPGRVRQEPPGRVPVRRHDPVPDGAAVRPPRAARRGAALAVPTRPLVTRYEDDLRLFPDGWHKLGLLLGAAVVLGFPFAASPSWLTVGNHALIAIVGAVGLMILTGFAGQISLGHA